MDKIVSCPICGSDNTTCHKTVSYGSLTLGNDFKYEEVYYVCGSCKEEGDFFSETDKNYLASEKKAQAELVKSILEKLNQAHISMAMLERVLELPVRTLTRWKNGDFSSSSLALLRILITFPWIINVAEQKFDSIFARSSIVKAAIQVLEQKENNVVHLSTTTTLLEKGSSGSISSFNITLEDSGHTNKQPSFSYATGR